ncbi:hypothetical protein N7490_004580 [Penicillium lividum]|nr:hypothetical protein N7490_004580 [Penicillium lividum]
MSGEPLPSISDLENPLETNQDRLTEGPNARLPKVDVTTCAMLTVRLIRHARQVWPEAFPVIARQFSRFLTRSNLNEAGKSTSDRAKIHRFKTQKYNECLWEFSLPTKTHPFRSAFIQQQAQFELLRAMASNKPVLPVTRTGYRAVVAVQLAHKKTTAERQSADLKAPSWPPWKEERLGMDAQRGNEGLHSRAMNVLSQMKEAGYSPQLWEEMSAILAGWDSDGSPTVQTRALASRRPLSLKISLDRNRELVWAARIRATRTVREAWACFLSYQDQGLPLKAVIYAAMAEKLIFRHKAANSHFDLTSHALPGDGREVYPEPASARDIIYVRTEPPTLDDFLDGMISQGFRPSGKLLSLLLQSAPSFSSGLAYLQCSNLTEDQIIALCTVWHQPSEYQAHRKVLEALPDFVFGSFIQFLCRHSRTTVATYARDVFMADRLPERIVEDQYNEPLADLSEYQEPEWQTGHPMALWHAIQLVKLRQPPCRWAWHNLLSTFSRDPIQGFHRAYDKWLVRILAWHGMLQVLNWMRARKIELGPKDFQPLCVSFYKAVDAGIQQPSKAEKAFKLYQTATKAPEVEGRDEFDTLIEDGLLLLKTHFDQLVLPSARTSGVAEKSIFGMYNKSESPPEMPTVLHVPSYATLHSFVRAMGIVGDDDGLLHLLRWMSQSAELLNELAEERLNGERMMRQTLVAIRLYLEKLHPQSVNGDRIASDCKVQEAYDIVSRTLGWEWPSNAEIEEYLLYNTVTFT